MGRCAFVAVAMLLGISAPANAEDTAPASDPVAASRDFWNSVHTTVESENWKALQSQVGLAQQSRAAAIQGVKTSQQATMNVTLASPEATAKFLERAAAASSDPAAGSAVATALKMRAPPQMVEAAAPLVAPPAQAQVQQFRANLSTGIPGLPGIYLNYDPSSHGASPPSAPPGYQPVSGYSGGCPSR